MSEPASGVEPCSFGGAQKAGQTPQSGQVNSVYTEGKQMQNAGLTPHLGFDPTIRALCKRGINVKMSCLLGLLVPSLALFAVGKQMYH